ncbi:hypothetical protein HYT92_00115 [Candidatus Pacearchaeota archaeon]|nr:hypothetical protein [Candidatus Pacearchaeota archaeon]
MAKKILALGLAAALALGSVLSFPYAKTAYKRGKARNLVKAAASEFIKFDTALARAREAVEVNSYLLVDEEREKPYAEISDSGGKRAGIDEGIAENNKLFERKEYDNVRINLDSRFGLKKGRRDTLIDVMKREEQELKEAADFCEGKRGMRNEVWANELYLIAKLKSPCKPEEKEKSERLSLLSDELFRQIPAWSEELEEKLKNFDKELHNSLGTSLITYQPILEHILNHGKSERVNDNALKIYHAAENSYKQVMPLNDQLLWYRPQKHDGKMPVISYKELLNKQRKAVGLIKDGDSQLQRLKNYYNELHEQYYVYVSSHGKEHKRFSHTGFRDVTEYDSDGEPYTTTEMYTYYTDGWKFYYVATKVTPSSQANETVYVGEKDGLFSSWNYENDEEVGFVREWKRLHDDNSAIVRGRIEALKPAIEQE